MKHLFIILFLIAGVLKAQEFGDESFFGGVTTVLDASTFQLRQSGQTKTITWAYMNALLGSADSIRAADNTWTGTNDFTSILKAPSTIVATTVRGLGFNSGLFSWVSSDTIRTAADRAWVLDVMVDSSVAVDTTNFGMLSANNAWTGTNTFSTQLAIGASTNNGALKIPVYTAANRPTAVDGSTFYNSTDNRIYVYESAWIPFLDSAAVLALVQTGSYLQTSGTQTGLSSTLTWSSGVLTPEKLSFGGHDAGKSLIMPMDKNGLVSVEEGSIYFDYNVTDNLSLYDGSGWIDYLNEDNIDTKIALTLAKTIDAITATVDTLTMSDASIITQLTRTTNHTIYIDNDAINIKTLQVRDHASSHTLTFTSSAANIITASGSPTFTLDAQKAYTFTIQYVASNEIWISYQYMGNP